MGSPVVKVPSRATSAAQRSLSSDPDDRAAFVEPLERRHPARGVLLGVLIGTGLWVAILALVGVIKF